MKKKKNLKYHILNAKDPKAMYQVAERYGHLESEKKTVSSIILSQSGMRKEINTLNVSKLLLNPLLLIFLKLNFVILQELYLALKDYFNKRVFQFRSLEKLVEWSFCLNDHAGFHLH